MKATLYATDKAEFAQLDLPNSGVKPHVIVYLERAFCFQDQGIKHGWIYREVPCLVCEAEPTDAPEVPHA